MSLLGHHRLVRLIIAELVQGGKTGNGLRDLFRQRLREYPNQREPLDTVNSGNFFRILTVMEHHNLHNLLDGVYYLGIGVNPDEYQNSSLG